MTVIVGVFVTRLVRGEVLPGQDAAFQIRVVLVHTGVDYSNGDALARAGTPHLLCLHGIEEPLLLPSRIRMRRTTRGTDQQQSEHRRCHNLAAPAPNTADDHASFSPSLWRSIVGGVFGTTALFPKSPVLGLTVGP
ncbi:hypothetical protein [Streptomyces sp. NPDC051572]|uniref:hypothetical protein n=1 Tax=Streptomyces sp. NPDC051572 TaxID=3155802 RepID=UPI00344CB36D